tara:strand:- start:16857 stop:17054 length:198 start_codon:yes stop_codon:yes gene_type:complete
MKRIKTPLATKGFKVIDVAKYWALIKRGSALELIRIDLDFIESNPGKRKEVKKKLDNIKALLKKL